jgi:hypothetical protein
MKLGYLFVIAAVVTFVFGLGFVLLPEQLLSIYGVNKLDPAGILIGRLFGAALLGYGALYWFARDAEDSEARRAMLIGGFVSAAVGFVAFLLAQLGGVVNGLGWVNVAIYLLLAVGFGYFLAPRVASDPVGSGTS